VVGRGSLAPERAVAILVGTSSPGTTGRPLSEDGGVRLLLGLTAALLGAVGAVLHAVNEAEGRVIEPSFWLLAMLAAVAFGLAGAFVGRRSPVVSSVMLGIGIGQGAGLLGREYALLGAVPLDAAALWLGSWLWAPSHLAVGVLLPLLLPDGRLPSPRWRPALALSVLALVAQSAWWAVTPYELQDVPFDVRGLRNPVGIEAAADPPYLLLASLVSVAAGILSLASVVVRWRTSTDERRQQLKWLLVGVTAAVTLFVAGFLVGQPAGEVVAGAAVLPLPVAAAFAAVRHRLWDVDIVVSAGLRYGVLSLIVAAVYAAVVAVLGGLAAAPVVATVVVALLLLPAHGWVQRWVNEWVHGEADDPATALARLGDRLEATSDPAEVADHLLPDVAARLAGLLRAPYVAVALADGETFEHGEPVEAERIPLLYGRQQVGELRVAARERSPAERRRLDQLARQSAAAAHSVLLARETRRARQEVVAAREEERRRLRRDLHDGLGPVLAALALQAETARELVRDDPGQATAMLDRLVPRLNDAVADVRALVHELRPPTLDELGLAGALRELAARFRGAGRQVVADVPDLGDLPAAAELAAYRIAAEALANAVRHGRPGRVAVEVARTPLGLTITVTDDGCGIGPEPTPGLGLRSMRQRAEELGGTCTISPGQLGRGTEVRAELPVAAEPEVVA